jgi:MHS family proline/betaine transporter-like MFS transporter
MNLDSDTALIYLSYSSFVMMVANPIAGSISDVIGRFKTIIYAAVAVFIFAVPTFWFLSSPNFLEQMIALSALGLLAGGMSGGAYIFIISLFPPEERFTGVAFSYNLGIAVFGGTSPIIARWLVETTGLFYAPAFYIMCTSIVFLSIMYVMKNYVSKTLKNLEQEVRIEE